MIQGFRPPRWLACAALVAAVIAPAASAYAGPLAPARHSPARPAADDPYEELAGSVAGVGRERPGRPAGERANPDLTVASRPLPVRPRTRPTPPAPPTVAPTPPEVVIRALGTEPNDRAADLAAHILPLGTGFALMGLGLGYMGVRLRRSI
ncbi:hypothetical protein OG756_20220 [Streptomyces sp. NBC_01310]|uniref:hypothetical protein n=1 Tax=Streptomyces sp. NBC_01310 TaxID=2903820 RepID=UPI0035B64325|nr:hypothetical protein OG756_20220 [Streptomyces sp. NBC_01310]